MAAPSMPATVRGAASIIRGGMYVFGSLGSSHIPRSLETQTKAECAVSVIRSIVRPIATAPG